MLHSGTCKLLITRNFLIKGLLLRLLLVSEVVDNMGNRTAYVSRATADHNCSRNPHEASRVREAGGEVDAAGYIGSMLEVSRSMGDFLTKEELGNNVIIAEPEVYSWKLSPPDLMVVAVSDVSKRHSVVGPNCLKCLLTCWTCLSYGPPPLICPQGVSGTMDDTEICNMVTTLLNDKKHLNDPEFAARKCCTCCIHRLNILILLLI